MSERDHDADGRLRSADGLHGVLDTRRLDLCEADHRHESQQQRSEAQKRSPVGGLRGVLVLFEIVVLRGNEEVTVPYVLDEDEHDVERKGRDAGEDELRRGELRTGRARRERRKHEAERGEGDNAGERRRGAFRIEGRDATAERRHEEREPDDPVARDHHGGEDGVARESVRLRASRCHEGDDEAELDDRDGDREHERSDRLADTEGDDLRMVDGREHGGGEKHCHESEHRCCGLAAPGHDQDEDGRDRRGKAPREEPADPGEYGFHSRSAVFDIDCRRNVRAPPATRAAGGSDVDSCSGWIAASILTILLAGFVALTAASLRFADCANEATSECSTPGLVQLVVAWAGLAPVLVLLVQSTRGHGRP